MLQVRSGAFRATLVLLAGIGGCADQSGEIAAPDVQESTLPPLCTDQTLSGRKVVFCEYPFNYLLTAEDLEEFAQSTIAFTIQAVGGNGGAGSSSFGGTVFAGEGGLPGLAQTTIRGDALINAIKAQDDGGLFIYVGEDGADGVSTGGGGGGSASMVAIKAIDASPTETLDLSDILVVGAGGGGAQAWDQSNTSAQLCAVDITGTSDLLTGCAGGDGGVAIANDGQNRFGTALPGASLPAFTSPGGARLNVTGLPTQGARFDSGAWIPGEGDNGGGSGSSGLGIAGAKGSADAYAGVMNNVVLSWDDLPASPGSSASLGGAGGGGALSGAGSGITAGAGGVSYAVSSGFGLDGEVFDVPCLGTDEFCPQNWLGAKVDQNQPLVAVTIWQTSSGTPVIPTDGGTVDTDQPSLPFRGTGANEGIQYVVQSEGDGSVLASPAMGNLLWTASSGVLEPGDMYTWSVTDLSGETIQSAESFSVSSTAAISPTIGWDLYIRTYDGTGSAFQPLANQPKLTYYSFQFYRQDTEDWLVGAEFESSVSDCDTVTCANGFVFEEDSGSAYANTSIHLDRIAVDWGSLSSSLAEIIPTSAINMTTAPNPESDTDQTPFLALPDLGSDFQGDCGEGSIEVTFAAVSNGMAELKIWATADGSPSASPTTAVKTSGTSCSEVTAFVKEGTQDQEEAYYTLVFLQGCQAPNVETVGTLNFCLKPSTAYRTEFNATVPFLPGDMSLKSKLGGNENFAVIPGAWLGSCTWDDDSSSCDTEEFEAYLGRFSSSLAAEATAQSESADLDAESSPDNDEVLGQAQLTDPASDPWVTINGSTEGCTSLSDGRWQCVATENAVFSVSELPSDSWVVVQALGGNAHGNLCRGDCIQGKAGRAQAVLPGASLSEKDLYGYVGANAGGQLPNVTAAGAASVVTRTKMSDSFVTQDQCRSSAMDIEAIVIGGGGGNSWNQNASETPQGGDGGVAIGGSGLQSTIGSGAPGAGSSPSGWTAILGGNPYDGSQVVSGGPGVLLVGGGTFNTDGAGNWAFGGGVQIPQGNPTWFRNSSALSLATPRTGTCMGGGLFRSAGLGATGATPGGGGYAGGGGGFSEPGQSAAGAGGMSWAQGPGFGVTIPESLESWQELSVDSSAVAVTVVPTCLALSNCTSTESSCTCTFTESALPFDLSGFGEGAVAYIESWGGDGGKGGDEVLFNNQGFIQGCPGGSGGYAATAVAVSETPSVYLYVGSKGTAGEDVTTNDSSFGLGGGGGASSMVRLSALGSNGSNDGDFLAIAGAGAGGDGFGNSSLWPGGEGGGPSTATTAEVCSAGTARHGPTDEEKRLCSGQGGVCDNSGATPGGRGGPTRIVSESSGSVGPIAGWLGASSLTWTGGMGGTGDAEYPSEGSGGGGFDGGEGAFLSTGNEACGSGGGGTYTAPVDAQVQAWIEDASAPWLGPDNRPEVGCTTVAAQPGECAAAAGLENIVTCDGVIVMTVVYSN